MKSTFKGTIVSFVLTFVTFFGSLLGVYADTNLSFNTNGGTPINNVIIKTNQKIQLSSYITTKDGYSFSSWTDSHGKVETSVTGKKSKNGMPANQTVYANWTIINYNISYNLDGGVATGNPDSYNIESSSFTLVNPTKEHYTFTGWTGTDLTDKTITVTVPTGSFGDRVYTANFEINKYTLTFNTNGGSSIKSEEFDYNTEVDLANYVPTKTGYTFTGWYLDEDLTSKVTSITTEDNTTVYAGWEINKYTLTFNTNGGSSIESEEFDYNTEVDLANYVPTRTGYTFTGWYLDEGLTSKATLITIQDNTTVYAGW